MKLHLQEAMLRLALRGLGIRSTASDTVEVSLLFVSFKKLSGSASSAGSASAAARCTRVRPGAAAVQEGVFPRHPIASQLGRRNYASHSQSLLPNWPTGSLGPKREVLRWKRSGLGTGRLDPLLSRSRPAFERTRQTAPMLPILRALFTW